MFSCNLPPPFFWQNGQDLLHATAVTQGWNGYQNESAQKVDPREENSPAAPAGIQTLFPFFKTGVCQTRYCLAYT